MTFGNTLNALKVAVALPFSATPQAAPATDGWASLEAAPSAAVERMNAQRGAASPIQLVSTESVADLKERLKEAKQEEKNIGREAGKLDSDLTKSVRINRGLTPDDLKKFLEATQDDGSVKNRLTSAHLKTHLGGEIKLLMLETPGLSDEQKKDLSNRLFTEKEIGIAKTVKEKFVALQAEGADVSKELKGLLKSWQPASPSEIASILKAHPDLKMDKSPAAILAETYGKHAEVIGADKATLQAYRSLTNSFPAPRPER